MSQDLELDHTVLQYKQDLALLRKITVALDSSSEQDQVLPLALQTIVETMGEGFSGLLLVIDPHHPGLEIVAQSGLEPQSPVSRVFPESCPCGQALESGMPLFEAGCPGRGCPGAAARDGCNHLVVPLKVRQNVVGILCLLCPPAFEIKIWDLSIWEDVGVLLGRAVEDARLYVQIQQERELLHALYAVSDHLAASLDLEWVLSRVLDLAISATDARNGSIFMLPTPDSPRARILRHDLPPAEADMVIEQVLAKGLAGWVLRHRESALVFDVASDSRWVMFPGDTYCPGSALAVPFLAEGRVLGIVTLDHAQVGHFQARHVALMTAIAHQASTAIAKARLHNKVSQMAEILAQRVEEQTEELRIAQAQLIQAEKLAALGELAAGIAHEINNPLHILQSYLEYMASRLDFQDPTLSLVEPMRTALESIGRLAGQLRDFSKPSGGEWKLVDVNRAVESVLRLAGKELMHCKIKVIQSMLFQMPMVRGDTRQLEQVFLNLILNARDAMPGGGTLTIEGYSDADMVYVRFKDAGVGIPEDNLSDIFEPYFTTKEDRGTGLGLAICRRIVTQHGGKITVSSTLGQGTTFTVHLPIALSDQPQNGKAGSGATRDRARARGAS